MVLVVPTMIRRKNSQHEGARPSEAIAMKRGMHESACKRLDSDTLGFPDSEEDTGNRQQIFPLARQRGSAT